MLTPSSSRKNSAKVLLAKLRTHPPSISKTLSMMGMSMARILALVVIGLEIQIIVSSCAGVCWAERPPQVADRHDVEAPLSTHTPLWCNMVSSCRSNLRAREYVIVL